MGRLRFASREGLVPPVQEVNDEAAIAAQGLDKPYAHIVFDIHLLPETEGMLKPKTSAAARPPPERSPKPIQTASPINPGRLKPLLRSTP